MHRKKWCFKHQGDADVHAHRTMATGMSGIREDWLHLTQEEVLEPDLAIRPHITRFCRRAESLAPHIDG
jgi:hypothetical protein